MTIENFDHPQARGLAVAPASSTHMFEALQILGHDVQWASMPGKIKARLMWTTPAGAEVSLAIIRIARALPGLSYQNIARRLAESPDTAELFSAVYALGANVGELAATLFNTQEPEGPDLYAQTFIIANAVCKGIAALGALLPKMPDSATRAANLRNINEAEWRLLSVRDALDATPLPPATPATPEGEPNL